MATISMTVADGLLTGALPTFDGTTDPERTAAMKAWLKDALRVRIREARITALREAQNAAMRDLLTGLNTDLAD